MTNDEEFTIRRAAIEAELNAELLAMRVIYRPIPRNESKERERSKRWKKAHPENVRTNHRKGMVKRRGLGENLLNPWFIGCEGHHISIADVIHIPKALHRSVPHNIWTGQNMEQINALAQKWAEEVCAHITFN